MAAEAPEARAFNLIDAKWIPVLYRDGRFARVGIHEALADAGHIRGIAASNPMDNIALLRFLLAVVVWCKPELSDIDRKLLQGDAEGIPPDWLREKLGVIEHPNRAFNLLCEDMGFFQDRTAWQEIEQKAKNRKQEKSDDKSDGEGFRPATDLPQELPSGSSVAHFRHTRDFRDGLCAACCAVGLIRLSAFATASAHGSKQQKPAGINGGTPMYVVPSGNTLLRTLLLNLPAPGPSDNPGWVNEEAPKPNKIGLVAAFTWRPRRVWLERSCDQSSGRCAYCGETAALIRRIAFLPGWKRPFEKAGWSDDPHSLVAIEPPKTKRSKPKRVSISYPAPSQSSAIHARTWRPVLQAVLYALHADGNDDEPSQHKFLRDTVKPTDGEAIVVQACGPAANKALYQDATSVVLPFKCQRNTIKVMSTAVEETNGVLRRSTPNPERQHPERNAALDALSPSLEARLRRELNACQEPQKLKKLLRSVVQDIVSSTTPGSPLRRSEAIRLALSALDQTMRRITSHQQNESPVRDSSPASESDPPRRRRGRKKKGGGT